MKIHLRNEAKMIKLLYDGVNVNTSLERYIKYIWLKLVAQLVNNSLAIAVQLCIIFQCNPVQFIHLAIRNGMPHSVQSKWQRVKNLYIERHKQTKTKKGMKNK